MPGLLGQTKQLASTGPDLQSLLKHLAGGLNQDPMSLLFPGTKVDNTSIQPYLDLFTQQNTRNLAQAKESAGNLTGSGLGNIIGAEAGRASTEQGAFLANLFENRRQADAQRSLQALLGVLGSPAGQVQNVYQPGFLDYAAQGAGALAAGGAFNSLLGAGTPKVGAPPSWGSILPATFHP
jgi:hypothetical protein